MDRNLGASQVATSLTDSLAYGDLYQWGRLADGHQSRNSSTTAILSGNDDPGHNNFILSSNPAYDWRTPQNDNLWQGVFGGNNPCPAGFRLPTTAEWQPEVDSLGIGNENSAGAFASPLKLVVAGFRYYHDGSLGNAGGYGLYWASTVFGSSARYLHFNSGYATMSRSNRAKGFSVRCLKD